MVSRRHVLGSVVGFLASHPFAGSLLAGLQTQPFVSQVRRLADAMAYLGEPFDEADLKRIDAAANLADGAAVVNEIQGILDPHCLLEVRINPESRTHLGEPCRRSGATRRAGLARLPGQGAERSRRHGRAQLRKPAGEARVQAGHRIAEAHAVDPAGRRYGSLAADGHL
jgi:hypothetical protein